MPSCCLLDHLPVELFNDVFQYFWAHEILQSFSNVSKHIDDVLHSYSSHRVNLENILRKNFDLICDSIRPDQVILLRLSDEKTIGQSKLFFLRFQLEQFTQLQSLTFIEVEEDALPAVFYSFASLPRLRSLTFHQQKFPRKIYNTIEIPSQLNRFSSYQCFYFEDEPLPNLVYNCPTNIQLSKFNKYVNKQQISNPSMLSFLLKQIH